MSSSALRFGVAIFAVIAIGLVAGILLGTGMTGYTAKELGEAAWTQSFQLEDALFSKAMPPLFLTTLALLVLACLLTRGTARGLFISAAVLMIVVLIVTVKFEVPLNKQIQTWVPGSAPAYWAAIRDQWLSHHLVRTIASLFAFACAAGGLAKF